MAVELLQTCDEGLSSSAPPSIEEGLQELGMFLALQHLHPAAHTAHEALLCIRCPRSLLLRHAG